MVKSRWLLVHNSVRQTVVTKCMDEYLDNCVLSLSLTQYQALVVVLKGL